MKTVIILHGWGHSKEMWTDFVDRLQGDVAVEAWDLPGFSSEPLLSPDWTIADYATWATNKIVDRGLTDVVLLGHSFGGRISAYIAAENPSWLRAIILYGAPCVYRPSLIVRVKNTLAHAVGRLPIPAAWRERVRGSEDRRAGESGLAQVFRQAVQFDQAERLPRIAVPTLLLWGENDTEVPLRIAEEMQQLIPASTLDILPGAGHNAHLENPVLVYGKVKQFLASC